MGAFGDVRVSVFVAGQRLVMLECHPWWQGQHFGDVGMSLFAAGATFGDVAVSLFVAGGNI